MKDSFEKKLFTQGNDTLPYRIMYPKGYKAGKKYPLVLFLHGSGARGNDNEKQLINIPACLLDSKNKEHFQYFLLVPQCPGNNAWVNFPDFPRSIRVTDTPTTAAKMTLALIDDLIAKLNIDDRRIYITGFSMGGEGTFDLVTRRSRLFAAAVPICPVADTSKAALIKDVNLWVFHGAADSVNLAMYSRLMIDKLRREGARPIYTEYRRVGHKSWTKAYNEPDLLPWMFGKVNDKVNN